MLAWLLWQLERIERIRSVASALMSEFEAEAYAEARRRECEADGDDTAADWRRVALVVARRTSVRVELDAGTPASSGAWFTVRNRFGTAADIPDPICLRDGRSRADKFDGKTDSSSGHARRHHRRGKYKVAAPDDRSTDPRSRRPRSLCATESEARIELFVAPSQPTRRRKEYARSRPSSQAFRRASPRRRCKCVNQFLSDSLRGYTRYAP